MQRLIYSLVVILGLSFLFLLGVNYYNVQKTGSALPDRVSIPAIQEKTITKIDIQKGTFHIILEKPSSSSETLKSTKKPASSGQGSQEVEPWVVASEDNYPADRFNVSSLLDALKAMTDGVVVSRSRGSYPVYEVDDDHSVDLRLYEQGREKLHLSVGKSLENYTGTFVRVGDQPEVLEISQSLHGLIYTQRSSWLDRSLFRFNPDDTEAFEVVQQKGMKGKQAFKKEGEQWWLLYPFKIPMDNSLARDMASTLSYFDFDDLAPQKLSRKDAGLDSPSYELAFHYTLESGLPGGKQAKREEVSQTLKLGYPVKKGEDKYYAEVSGKDRFFIVSKTLLDNFFKPSYDLMKKNLWNLSPDTVKTMMFQTFYPDDLKIEREDIKKKQGGKETVVSDPLEKTLWRYRLGTQAGELSPEKVREFVNFLNQIKVGDYKEKVDKIPPKIYHVEILTTQEEQKSVDFYPDSKDRMLWVRLPAYPALWLKLFYSDYEQLVNELDDLLGRSSTPVSTSKPVVSDHKEK